MGRGKVKEIIEHRITLGTYERDRLDTLTTAWTFGRVLNPLVALISNPYAIASTVALLEALGVLNIRSWIKENTPLYQWYQNLNDGLYKTYEVAQNALDELGDLAGQIADFEIGDIDVNLPGEATAGATLDAIAAGRRTILNTYAWAKTQDQKAQSENPNWEMLFGPNNPARFGGLA